MLVVSNFSDNTVKSNLPEEITQKHWERLLTNYPENAPAVSREQDLAPWECEIYSLID